MWSRAADLRHNPLFFDRDTVGSWGRASLTLSRPRRPRYVFQFYGASLFTVPIRVVSEPHPLPCLLTQRPIAKRRNSSWTNPSPSGCPRQRAKAKVVGQHTYPFSITTMIPRDAKVAPGPKASPKRFWLLHVLGMR